MGRRSKPYSAYDQKERHRKMEYKNSPVSGISSLVANIVVYTVFGIFIIIWHIIKSIFSHDANFEASASENKKSIFAHEKTIYDLSRLQLIFTFAVGICIFLYVFIDFCITFGARSDLASSIFTAALLAFLGGAFCGMVLYFFNLVFRKE